MNCRFVSSLKLQRVLWQKTPSPTLIQQSIWSKYFSWDNYSRLSVCLNLTLLYPVQARCSVSERFFKLVRIRPVSDKLTSSLHFYLITEILQDLTLYKSSPQIQLETLSDLKYLLKIRKSQARKINFIYRFLNFTQMINLLNNLRTTNVSTLPPKIKSWIFVFPSSISFLFDNLNFKLNP